MLNMVEHLIKILRKEDILKYAKKNGLKTTDEEIDFVFNFIKENYSKYITDPNSLDISLYKSKFSNENYQFIKELIEKHKKSLM